MRPQLEVEHRHNGERLLRLLQQQHPDYHPILAVARIAHMAEDNEEYDVALRAHSTVLKYVEPELKSIEVKVGRKEDRIIEVTLFGESAEPIDLVPNEPAVRQLIGEMIDVESVPG